MVLPPVPGQTLGQRSWIRCLSQTMARKEIQMTLIPRRYLKIKTNYRTLILSFVALVLTACSTTYHLDPESLRTQIAQTLPAEGTFVFTTGGLFLFNKMINNGIRTLVVMDKAGNEKWLKVNQRTQIRIHKQDGDYSTFYFDTLYFHNDSVVGQRTHFFSSEIKPISFKEIVKIEIQ
jgi:hypothetical protein